MKLSEQLFNAAKPIWDEIMQEPFVKGIGDGTIDKERYKFYTLQDNLYLIEYVKSFALGITKCHSEKHMRTFIKLMDGALGSETDTHNEFLKKMGISKDEIKNAKASLANTSYTNYMISVSSSGTAIHAAVAILACAWSYLYIGKLLAKKSGYKNTFYTKDWVDLYSSKGYEEDIIDNINIIDDLYVEGMDISYLKEIIITCSRYELEFWRNSYKMEL